MKKRHCKAVGKEQIFPKKKKNGGGTIGYMYGKKNETCLLLYTTIKRINSSWIKYLNVKGKIVKSL